MMQPRLLSDEFMERRLKKARELQQAGIMTAREIAEVFVKQDRAEVIPDPYGRAEVFEIRWAPDGPHLVHDGSDWWPGYLHQVPPPADENPLTPDPRSPKYPLPG